MNYTDARRPSDPPFPSARTFSNPGSTHTDVALPESPTAVPWRRQEEFWFDDGNIVLVAEGSVAFRVYKGILCKAGAVWAALLNRHDGPMSEGIPVVSVTDDPDELTLVMRKLMSPQRYVHHL